MVVHAAERHLLARAKCAWEISAVVIDRLQDGFLQRYRVARLLLHHLVRVRLGEEPQRLDGEARDGVPRDHDGAP